MQEAIEKLVKWVDKNEIPFHNGDMPAWGKALTTLIGFTVAVVALIKGDIWLKAIFLIFSFAIAIIWLIKIRMQILMFYYTKIKYSSSRDKIKNIIIIASLLISLQILGTLGVFENIGQLWRLIRNSFVDVVNVSRGLEGSIDYNRSVGVLLLLIFGIFVLQLINPLSLEQQSKESYLLNLYIRKSCKYEWAYFLNWLKDKDWDLICGNSIRVVGRENILRSANLNSSVKEYVQNRGRRDFIEFKNNLILNSTDCRLVSLEKGRVKLEIYPAELVRFFDKDRNKKILQASLNHFICQEILGIESLLVYENENELITEASDYEFLHKIDFSVADFRLKPKLQPSEKQTPNKAI